ncbi:MAG: hypothetical protein KC505_11565 [Myxococcales bacterium]|nr:hypothetical protein [Myxococcales bacterium]USN50950.1 MAG: hypothetical protein H6731_00595 [Myxococcales bacterium]
MKKLFVLLVIYTFNINASAPNFYECTGENIQISYYTGSTVHPAELHIAIKDQKEIIRQGKAIIESPSILGPVISIERRDSPQEGNDYDALLIPDVNIIDEKEKVEFISFFFKYTHKNDSEGSSHVDGLINEVKEFQPIHCAASRLFL